VECAAAKADDPGMSWTPEVSRAVPAALAAIVIAPLLAHRAFAAWVRRRHPARGERIAWPGGALHVVRRGAGPPVLLVHGMNGTALDFPDELVQDLARDHDVLALDRPGHGASPRTRAPLDLDANARAVLATLERVGGRAVIVGHSYGAAVALRAALDSPQLVRALVLVTPCTVVDERNRTYAELPLPPGRARRWALWTGTLPVGLWVTRRTRREAWHPAEPPSGFPPSRLYALIPAQLEAALENFHTLEADLGELASDLSSLAVPAIVLAGREDVVTPWRAHAEWLPERSPQVTLRVGEGAGHWLMRQRPELVAAAVREAGAAAR
jgi:pimeloyl-ACP methyl ester carboxylesterase